MLSEDISQLAWEKLPVYLASMQLADPLAEVSAKDSGTIRMDGPSANGRTVDKGSANSSFCNSNRPYSGVNLRGMFRWVDAWDHSRVDCSSEP